MYIKRSRERGTERLRGRGGDMGERKEREN